MRLSESVALITGSARRVGRAIALELAREGAAIAVHFRESADDAQEVVTACRAMGARAEAFAADLHSVAETSALANAAHTTLGPVSILVNNAAVFEPMTLDEYDADRWTRTMRVNVEAPMQLAFELREDLVATTGTIVNIHDISTHRPWPTHIAYSVSKGALDTLTAVLARAMAPHVNVVGVAPGVAAWPEDMGAEQRERILERVPLGREGSCDDIARLVRFLVAEGGYITGAVLPVDGGRSVV